MKYQSILVVIILSISNIVFSQNEILTKEFQLGAANQLKLECDYGDVTIETWDKNSVKAEISVIVNGKNEIEAFDIEGRQRGNRYIIESSVDFDDIEEMVSIKDDEGNWTMFTTKEFKKLEGQSHEGLNYGYRSEITIKYWIPRDIALETDLTYGDVKIENVTTKPLDLHTTYGNIEADFSSTRSLPELEIHTTYGAVDLTLDDATKANLEMHTSYGEILTNFDMEYKHSNRGNNSFGEDIISKLNGGGQDLVLEATYGKVYLRKSK